MLRTAHAQDGTAHTANPLNATRAGHRAGPSQTFRGSQPGDAYLHRAPEAFGMRRRGRQGHFLAGVVCATTGLGLCGEGLAMAVAPQHPAAGQVLFFVAIVVPFAIFLTVLMVPRLGSLREITVAILGLYPAMVYRMSSPLVLAGYDEHQHEQSLMNLLQGSGLFSPNPVLRVSPYYPGLELFTGVGIRLTGLPVVLAMSLVVLLCRLLLVLIIYHSALLVSPSRRGASLVVAFYAVSSEFYSFNSGFSYQTLALTLGLGGILPAASRPTCRLRRGPPAFFYRVAGADRHCGHSPRHKLDGASVPHCLGGDEPEGRAQDPRSCRGSNGSCCCHLDYSPRYAPGQVLCANLFERSTELRRLFWREPAGITSSALAEERRRSRTGSVSYWSSTTLSCTLAALVCAWIMLSRAFRNRDRMLGLLGALDLAFPITAAAHFNPSVGELGDRASTFLFFPLALSCSLIIQRHPRVIRRPARRHNPFRPAVLIALIGGTTVIYLGGILLGSNPDWQSPPGPLPRFSRLSHAGS